MPAVRSDDSGDILPVSVESYTNRPGGALPLARSSGILLHITSLPGPYGAGDLGPEAYRFADFLAETGQRIWQVLPLGPAGLGDSPYSSPSTFAMDPVFASPELMMEDGLLNPEEGHAFINPALDRLAEVEQGTVRAEYLAFYPGDVTPHHASCADFDTARRMKTLLLKRAFERFEAGETPIDPAAFDAFCKTNAHWLDDYALFMALREEHGNVEWTKWKREYALRDPYAIRDFCEIKINTNDEKQGHLYHYCYYNGRWHSSTETKKILYDKQGRLKNPGLRIKWSRRNQIEELRRRRSARIRRHKFAQFVVYDQWNRLKRYCNEREILLFGDIPIYVAHDSADVWAHPDLFQLDEYGQSAFSGGVPPDYFSKTGQHWHNPTYRWDRMRENNFAWWARRLEAIMKQVDLVRLDHFRGFQSYWEIPAGEETAVNGKWVAGPGLSFFESMEKQLGALPLVVEDLGFITKDVRGLIQALGCPGMAVLQFAFDHGTDNPFLPHNNPRNIVLYTGTHDNDTFLGWWEKLASDPKKKNEYAFARAYLGLNDCPEQEAHWAALPTVLASPAEYVVFPMQDLLGLGTEARMNTPGVPGGNWGWRFTKDQLTPDIRERLKNLTGLYGRAKSAAPS